MEKVVMALVLGQNRRTPIALMNVTIHDQHLGNETL